MQINKRLFGTPLEGEVRKKLEDRQKIAGATDFGDSITPVFPDKYGKNQVDLSSRTAFARMWTSVKLYDTIDVIDKMVELGEFQAIDYFEAVAEEQGYDPNNYQEGLIQSVINQSIQNAITDAKKLAAKNVGSKVFVYPPQARYGSATSNNTDVDGNPLPLNVDEVRVIVKTGKDEKYREKMDFARKIYVIGDSNYNKNYGEASTNSSVEDLGGETFEGGTTQTDDDVSDNQAQANRLFPNELSKNLIIALCLKILFNLAAISAV